MNVGGVEFYNVILKHASFLNKVFTFLFFLGGGGLYRAFILVSVNVRLLPNMVNEFKQNFTSLFPSKRTHHISTVFH